MGMDESMGSRIMRRQVARSGGAEIVLLEYVYVYEGDGVKCMACEIMKTLEHITSRPHSPDPAVAIQSSSMSSSRTP